MNDPDSPEEHHPRRRRIRSGGNYDVGYGRPPKQYRFRPGESGNRKGRPKGAKGNASLLREILDRKVKVNSARGLRRISIREAMLTRLTDTALKGCIKATAFLLAQYDHSEPVTQSDNEGTTPEEQEIIDTYLERVIKQRGGAKS
jgi:hypothetical protein